MIDSQGYRANVGIVLSNDEGKVFWARRKGQNDWQFPQGGIEENEAPNEAMFRELKEETGLHPKHVKLIGRTNDWLRYKIPQHLLRHRSVPLCIGQKQIWYFLKLVSEESAFDLCCSEHPEFDGWRWVDYWLPVEEVIEFKRQVYHQALTELERYVLSCRD